MPLEPWTRPTKFSRLTSDKGAETVSSTNGAETTGRHVKYNEFTQRPHALHENQLKMDQRTKCEMQNYKLLEGYTGGNLHDHDHGDDFLDPTQRYDHGRGS